MRAPPSPYDCPRGGPLIGGGWGVAHAPRLAFPARPCPTLFRPSVCVALPHPYLPSTCVGRHPRSNGGGVVVDGFPRTMVQALVIKHLFDQMKQLRDLHVNDPVLKNKFRWGGEGVRTPHCAPGWESARTCATLA
jgi:hypothetical protein